MKIEFISSVSPQGQITLPLEIRRQLNIKPKDKGALILDGAQVQVIPLGSPLETSFGAVPALNCSLTDKEKTAIAAEEHAHQVVAGGV